MGFKKELANIGDCIVEKNPKLWKAVSKHNRAKDKDATDYEIKSSTVSFFFQEIENCILECMTEYASNNSYSGRLSSKCYDGMMIEKTTYKPQLLTELNVWIKERFGFDLVFTEKEIDNYLDILDDHNDPLASDRYEFITTLEDTFNIVEKDIADYVMFKYLKTNYKCTVVKKREFYHFKKHRWVHDVSCVTMKRFISKNLVFEY